MSDLIVSATTDFITQALDSASSVALINTALKSASSLSLAILAIVEGLFMALGSYLAGLTVQSVLLHIIFGLGFTDAGITAGSWAAALMASYGGSVHAGSLCAILQSVGATQSLVALGSVVAGTVGAPVIGVAAVVGAAILFSYVNDQENDKQ